MRFVILQLCLLALPMVNCKLFGHRSSRNSLLTGEEGIRKFLCSDYEKHATQMCTTAVTSEWNHLVDLDNKTKADLSIKDTINNGKLELEIWTNYFKDFDTSDFKDKNLARQLKRLSILGIGALSDDKLSELITLQNDMVQIYSTAKICPFSNPKCNIKKDGLPLDPDLHNIMAKSQDYDELLYTWVAWRDATGPKLKKKFESYVELSNEAARANNFTDKGEMWRFDYETPDMEEELDRLWGEVEPLYNELHAYVLRRLRTRYKKEMEVDTDNMIPAHILGNMWGQSWINIRSIVKPFPEFPDIDVTEIFRKKGIKPLKMFQMANEFYTSLGLPSMEVAFNTTSGALIEKPKTKNVLCHASAWDFCDGKDFRIKMCTQVNLQDFLTIHHELGHILYYMMYKHQPITYRTGANPGFHEAIGDTIALSVSTSKHMLAIGLIDSYNDTIQENLNELMDMALERLAFLPYALLIDKWRWDIFAERIDPDQWNLHYWHYREKYQKIKAPIPRTEEDFDAGSKFHIPADSQYISYFYAHILEFQIHRSLCLASEQYRPGDHRFPLHKCDIYRNKKAGAALKKGLKLGASKHWKYVLNEITGEKELSAQPILEYFQPLYKFLVLANNQCDNE